MKERPASKIGLPMWPISVHRSAALLTLTRTSGLTDFHHVKAKPK